LYCKPVSSPVIIFERNSGSFSSLPEGSGTCWQDSRAPHSAGSAQIWLQCDTCSDCLSECSELTHVKLLTCYQLYIQWFLSFWGHVPYLIHIFICFAFRWMSQTFGIFNRG
jgi:hypothetical protein